LLLTISNALVRDLYFQARPHQASTEQRVIVSKFVLMAVALAAAFVASRRSSDILPMVAASFSIAASAFVPVMVLGIFWRGTNRMGAVAGMLSGLGVTLYYMLSHTALAQALFPKAWLANGMWWDIQPVSAAVFGVPVGLVVAIVVSYWKKP
jgi:cation/acetate symporter